MHRFGALRCADLSRPSQGFPGRMFATLLEVLRDQKRIIGYHRFVSFKCINCVSHFGMFWLRVQNPTTLKVPPASFPMSSTFGIWDAPWLGWLFLIHSTLGAFRPISSPWFWMFWVDWCITSLIKTQGSTRWLVSDPEDSRQQVVKIRLKSREAPRSARSADLGLYRIYQLDLFKTGFTTLLCNGNISRPKVKTSSEPTPSRERKGAGLQSVMTAFRETVNVLFWSIL